MIHVQEFRRHVIDPVLSALGAYHPTMNSRASHHLMIGTALAESTLINLEQVGGPARSFFGIEPGTFDDVFHRYLPGKSDLLNIVVDFKHTSQGAWEQIAGNQHFACAIARVKYWMDPTPLPNDSYGLALVWKRVYNTMEGKGTPAQFMLKYRNYVVG